MELSKEQAKALAAILYDEISASIRKSNTAVLEELEDDETFNNAYKEYQAAISKAKNLESEALKMRKNALRNLKSKLSDAYLCEWDSRCSMIQSYAKKLGKAKSIPSKQDIINRIMLATIDAKDLATLKENVLKMF